MFDISLTLDPDRGCTHLENALYCLSMFCFSHFQTCLTLLPSCQEKLSGLLTIRTSLHNKGHMMKIYLTDSDQEAIVDFVKDKTNEHLKDKARKDCLWDRFPSSCELSVKVCKIWFESQRTCNGNSVQVMNWIHHKLFFKTHIRRKGLIWIHLNRLHQVAHINMLSFLQPLSSKSLLNSQPSPSLPAEEAAVD